MLMWYYYVQLCNCFFVVRHALLIVQNAVTLWAPGLQCALVHLLILALYKSFTYLLHYLFP